MALLCLSYSLPAAQSRCGGLSFTADGKFGLGFVCSALRSVERAQPGGTFEILVATVACGCWGLKLRW